jgi:hypothetical protein
MKNTPLYPFVSNSDNQKLHTTNASGPALLWIMLFLAALILSGCTFSPQAVATPTTKVQIVQVTATPIVVTATPEPTQTPTSTPRVYPTNRPIPTMAPLCLPWTEITTADVGKELCVYGDIQRTRWVRHNFQIKFARGDDDFYFALGGAYYEVSVGDCVAAEGEVLLSNDNVPYLNISEALYRCKSWMK